MKTLDSVYVHLAVDDLKDRSNPEKSGGIGTYEATQEEVDLILGLIRTLQEREVAWKKTPEGIAQLQRAKESFDGPESKP